MINIMKIFATCVALLAIAGCALTTETRYKEQLGVRIAPTLSKEAFERVEPALKYLQPGQLLSATGLKWTVRGLEQGGQTVGILSVADGWAGALSGEALGALSRLGELYAISEGKVHGRHIYGFIAEPAVFIPRYEVKTVGTIISEIEYEQYKDNDSYAWLMLRDETKGSKERIFLKDVKVAKVREIPMQNDIQRLDATQVSNDTKQDTINRLFSKELFYKSEDKIKAVQPGTDVIGVLGELNGYITANYGGESFIFNIDGLLSYDGNYKVSKQAQNGISSVWPFGYVENGHVVPKLAMIFKNGVVERVVPYSSKVEISAMLK